MIKLILVGAGGSGKDFFAKKLIEKGAKKSVSYTTRPIRDNEIDGIDYHFISEEEFKHKIEQGFWYEYDCFRGWYYGASKLDIETCDLFIKTPAGITFMTKEDRLKYTVIYLDIEESVRKERLEQRNDVDDVERRLRTDKDAFENFTDFDVIVKNYDF